LQTLNTRERGIYLKDAPYVNRDRYSFSRLEFIDGGTSVNIREGNWNDYFDHIAGRRGGGPLPTNSLELLTYKRQCALAYLGKRALLHGGVCSKTAPRILTAQIIEDLSEANRAKRHNRYPCIERLLNLLAEIELIQDQCSIQPSVFSLVQPVEARDESLSSPGV